MWGAQPFVKQQLCNSSILESDRSVSLIAVDKLFYKLYSVWIRTQNTDEKLQQMKGLLCFEMKCFAHIGNLHSPKSFFLTQKLHFQKSTQESKQLCEFVIRHDKLYLFACLIIMTKVTLTFKNS